MITTASTTPTTRKTLRGLRASPPRRPRPGPDHGPAPQSPVPESGRCRVSHCDTSSETRQWMCTWAEISTSPAIATNSTVR